MTARAIRNKQVPKYCFVDFGVHAIENSGVVEEEKKVMAMFSILIIVVLDDPMSMELMSVAMDIGAMVLEATSVMDIDIDMVII